MEPTQKEIPADISRLSQDRLHQLVLRLQENLLPGQFDAFSETSRTDDPSGNYIFFSPSRFFNPERPVFTPEIVQHLREGAKLLSVGSGPSYTEQLLASALEVDRDNIHLADVSPDHVPAGFSFKQFDMLGPWPQLDSAYDYVVFLESVGVALPDGPFVDSGSFQYQPLQAEALSELFDKTRAVLKPTGEARMSLSEVNESTLQQAVRRSCCVSAGGSNHVQLLPNHHNFVRIVGGSAA